MTLQSSGEISLKNIANEFGYTESNGTTTKLGSYRTTNGQGNFPVSFGALQFNSIDARTGGSVPTGSSQIAFSDFYGTKLHTIVNFYSGSTENRKVAKDKYNSGDSSKVQTVGNYRTPPSDSADTKVHIHVNKSIGSETSNIKHCALRTGLWDATTDLQVDVGGSGRISGAGGKGGKGSTGSGSGFAGGDGSSGLGIQYDGTIVTVASGGFIQAGFAGGGGGGGGYDTDKEADRTASGGGGGGGAGIPAGEGGAAGTGGTQGANGGAGEDANNIGGGAGGGGSNNDGEATGGEGGDGGDRAGSAGEGDDGTGGEGSRSSGGDPGSPGAAIRRNSGFTVTIDATSLSRIHGNKNATGVL